MIAYKSEKLGEASDGVLLARPHFEAVIADIGGMCGETAIEVRESIKDFLIKNSLIKRSSTELKENELKEIANKLTAYLYEQEEEFELEDFLTKLPEILSIHPITMNFSQALVALKLGRKLARKGWNGQGMFLYFVSADSYPAQTEAAKAEFGSLVPYGAYIAIKTAQGNVVPWVASQTDLLSDDWEFVK